MARKAKGRVAILGGGAAGLFSARNLCEHGFDVVLIERSLNLGGLPSLNNEGWGHTGSYHLAAIPIREIALQVGRRTNYGFQQIMQFAPEAVEDYNSRTFALIKSEAAIDEVQSRWMDVGVPYRRIAVQDFGRIEPRVHIDEVAAIFEVVDKSLNTPLLYSKLADRAEELGAKILTGMEISSVQGNVAELRSTSGGSSRRIAADIFVYTTGYGTKELFRTLFDIDLPLRFWRSHLLDLPRLTQHGLFFIEPGEATLMHHQHHSIAGLNADQIRVDEPSFAPVEENIQALKDALRRLIDIGDVELASARARACTKVDRDPGEYDMFLAADGTRYPRPSLNVAFDEPIPGHIWALPGKMTEAPFLAAILTDMVSARLRGTRLLSSMNRAVQKDVRKNMGRRPIDAPDLNINASVSQ